MALAGLVELVGPFYIAAIVFLSALLARWQMFDHLIAIVMLPILALALIATVGESLQSNHSRVWLESAILLWLSGYAMTVASAKLGRILAHGLSWAHA